MTVTKLQAKIFRVIWKLDGRATVQQILDAWEETKKPQYTTILKTLQIMEEKDLVAHEKEGRSYVYRPNVSKDEALGSNVLDLVKTFFSGNKMAFAQTFIDRSSFTREEIQELKRFLEKKEGSIGSPDS